LLPPRLGIEMFQPFPEPLYPFALTFVVVCFQLFSPILLQIQNKFSYTGANVLLPHLNSRDGFLERAVFRSGRFEHSPGEVL
jgi:hypothetical protein